MILFQKKNYSKYENKIYKMSNLQLHYSITNIKPEKKKRKKEDNKQINNSTKFKTQLPLSSYPHIQQS